MIMRGTAPLRWVAAMFMSLAMLSGMIGSASAAMTIYAKALEDHDCDDSEWHFVINQVDDAANAPSSISVTWANGMAENVPLDKFTGSVAHYATTSYLDSVVTSASAEIYDDWSGQFNLSHGPCGEPSPTPTSTPPPPPTSTPSPTPTSTPSPTPTSTPSPTPTNTPSPTPTNTPSPTPAKTPRTDPTPTFTPTVPVTETPTATATKTPSHETTPTAETTPTGTVSQLPSTGAGGGGSSMGGMIAALIVTAGALLAAGAWLTRRMQRA